MLTDKGKKQKVATEKGEEQIDGELVLSIEKLQEIQDQLEKINENASDEVLEVEQRYIEVRKPVYDKRKEIIQSIPEFWLTAFLSHPTLSQLLNDEDHKIFKYFESLEVEESKDVRMGYTITFNFNSNPYFEDSKLSKTFNFLDEDIIKVSSTPIKWKEVMGISNRENVEKKRSKRPLNEERSEVLDPFTRIFRVQEGEEEDFNDEDDDDEDLEDGNEEENEDDDDEYSEE